MVLVLLVEGWRKLTLSPAVGIVHVCSLTAIFKRNSQKKM